MKIDKSKVLQESKETFLYLSRSIIRTSWLENHNKNLDYYYDKQWYNHQLKEGLDDIGCETITINRIKPLIDRYLSILIKSGKRIGYMATTDSQYHINKAADIKNWAFNIQTQNSHTYFSSLKCLASLSGGIGWSHFYNEDSKFYYENVDPREMYLDPDDMSSRCENQNVIARSYFVNINRLNNLYPKYKSDFEHLVQGYKNSTLTINSDDFSSLSENVWVSGRNIRVVELYEKKTEKYYETTATLEGDDSDLKQEYVFSTFSKEVANKKAISDIKIKYGTKIYKTVFCDNILLFHGPINGQIPNQKFFPYVPVVFSRNLKGEFLGITNYMISLQDLWNNEISKLFHYSNSKLILIEAPAADYEAQLAQWTLQSKKKRGIITGNHDKTKIIDNSVNIEAILKALDLINREFQNLSGLFDDFAGKPTNAESGIAIQTRVTTTLNAQNSLVLAYEHMLVSEGTLMLDTLKGIENFKEMISYYSHGNKETSVLDDNICILNFDIYPDTSSNFNSTIEEEKEIFNTILSSGFADMLLSSPLFLQKEGMSESSAYSCANEYMRVLTEKMQLQQGIIPGQGGNTNQQNTTEDDLNGN